MSTPISPPSPSSPSSPSSLNRQAALSWATQQVYDWVCSLGPSFEPFASRLAKAGFDGKKLIGLAGLTNREFQGTLRAMEVQRGIPSPSPPPTSPLYGEHNTNPLGIPIGHMEKLLAEVEEACLAVKLTDESFLQQEMERCVDGVMRAAEAESNELCVLYALAFCSLIRKAVAAIDPVVLNSNDRSVLKQRRQTLVLLNDLCRVCDGMVLDGTKEPTSATVLSVVLVLAETAAALLLVGHGSSIVPMEESVTLPPEIIRTLDLKEDEAAGGSTNGTGAGIGGTAGGVKGGMATSYSEENLLSLSYDSFSPANLKIPPGAKLLETSFGPEDDEELSDLADQQQLQQEQQQQEQQQQQRQQQEQLQQQQQRQQQQAIPTRTVVLTKQPDEKFGMAISFGGSDNSVILVGNLASGGVADKSRQVFKGDEIVAVNGKSMFGFLPENVKTLILVSGDKLTLELRTYPEGVTPIASSPVVAAAATAPASSSSGTSWFGTKSMRSKQSKSAKALGSGDGSAQEGAEAQAAGSAGMRKQGSLDSMHGHKVNSTEPISQHRKMSAPPASFESVSVAAPKQQQQRQPVKQEVPLVACRDLINPKLSGWLWKLGGSGLTPKNWRKRWFVLHEGNLYYFKTAFDRQALGVVVLPAFTISDAPEIKKKWAFKAAQSGMRTYYFFAESRDDMLKWMNYLSLAAIKFFNSADMDPAYQAKPISDGSGGLGLSTESKSTTPALKKKDTTKRAALNGNASALANGKATGPSIDELAEFNNRKSLYDPNFGLPRPGFDFQPLASPKPANSNLPAAVQAANASKDSGREPRRVRVASPAEEASIDMQTKLKNLLERLRKKETELLHISKLFSAEITSERLQQFMMSARHRDSIYFGLDKETMEQLRQLS